MKETASIVEVNFFRGTLGVGIHIFVERSSSAINVLGAEHAARSMIRDKPLRSL